MKLTRLSTGLMAGLLAVTAACDSGNGNGEGEGEGVLDRLVVAPMNQTVSQGGSLQLTAQAIWDTGRSENVTNSDEIAWSTSDPAIAELEGARVNAAGPGEAIIEASYEGLTASTSVFVEATVDTIVVSPPEITLAAGTSTSASATGIATESDLSKRSVNGQVAWASSNQGVASVDATGSITAGDEAGESTISASQGGSVVGSVAVTVTDSAVAEVSAAVPNEEMLVGTSQPAIGQITLEDDHTQSVPLTWEILSQETDGADAEGPVIDADALADGVVVALQPGTATFEGSYGEDGTSGEVAVTVLAGEAPDSIEIAAPDTVAVAGQPFFVGATGDFPEIGTFSIGSLVFWASSDDTTLRLRGPQATPRSSGTVTVAASWPLDDGSTIDAEKDIEVVDSGVSGLSINSDSEALSAEAEFGSAVQDVTAAAYWSSSDDCAFVDNAPARSGQVTVLESPCDADITAEYGDQEASVSVGDIGTEE